MSGRRRPRARPPMELVTAMLGRRSISCSRRARRSTRRARGARRCAGSSAPPRFDDVSFDIRAGEIVGLAGLVGSGRTEIARALFGADPCIWDNRSSNSRPVRSRSPKGRIRDGMALLPESRKDQGLVMARPVQRERQHGPHGRGVRAAACSRRERERGVVGEMIAPCRRARREPDDAHPGVVGREPAEGVAGEVAGEDAHTS